MNSNITEIIEGTTKIRVPNDSISEKVPPKEPAFFNPKARLNRDFSIIAYSSFWKNFQYPKIFLDGLSGIGARSLRVANEIDGVDIVLFIVEALNFTETDSHLLKRISNENNHVILVINKIDKITKKEKLIPL